MPRFVLLHHECPTGDPRPTHYDLMLEADGALRTWTIVELPCSWDATAGLSSSVGENIVAEQLPDHRLAYLDFEGPVSGGRGNVSPIDAGTLTTVSESADRWVVALIGQRIRGQLELSRLTANGPRWQLTFQPEVRQKD
ncbi:MAG TPA: DNA polymerase ligase N-terminal domain-containing protein [Lacipirellulaceae bacterium]